MQKLSLNVDELRVETFETNKVEAVAGTVQGHMRTFPAPDYTCAYHCTYVLICERP